MGVLRLDTHRHTDTHTHTRTHARTHARTHTHARTDTPHTHTDTHRHIHTHTHARTHARTHTHTHTLAVTAQNAVWRGGSFAIEPSFEGCEIISWRRAKTKFTGCWTLTSSGPHGVTSGRTKGRELQIWAAQTEWTCSRFKHGSTRLWGHFPVSQIDARVHVTTSTTRRQQRGVTAKFQRPYHTKPNTDLSSKLIYKKIIKKYANDYLIAFKN